MLGVGHGNLPVGRGDQARSWDRHGRGIRRFSGKARGQRGTGRGFRKKGRSLQVEEGN